MKKLLAILTFLLVSFHGIGDTIAKMYMKKDCRNLFTARIGLFLVLLALSIGYSADLAAQTQVSVRAIDTTHLPKGVKYEGKIKTAVHWTDSKGYHLVITTETGIYRKDEFKHAKLFAYHFLGQKDSVGQTWKVHDFVLDCGFDVEASFVSSAFQVTDLDKDGTAEVWLMYKTGCFSDVSPHPMKLIMYEGAQKFAIRGENKIVIGTDDKGKKEYMGGDYKYDEAFASGPKEFLAFAKTLWNENITGE